jgi:hypothetical protein
MDVHIPVLVTQSLRRGGLDVLTSQEDGTAALDDEALLSRAVDLNRVLFSQDQDFLRIAAEWQAMGRWFPGVLFSPQRGVSLGRLAADAELLLTCCDLQEVENRVTYLPLS